MFIPFHLLINYLPIDFINYKLFQICSETGKKQTYDELLKRCVRTALHMKKRGLKEGDIIVTCSYNHLDGCLPFIASTFIGCLPASLDPTFSSAENKHLLSQIKPKIIFVSDESVAMIEKTIDELNYDTEIVVFSDDTNFTPFTEFLTELHDEEVNFKPVPCKDLNDTCLIAFSSGSVNSPKGICLTHIGALTSLTLIPSVLLSLFHIIVIQFKIFFFKLLERSTK